MKRRRATVGLILLAVGLPTVAACGPSYKDAIVAYSQAVADVASAGREDINRCETGDGGAPFCERAKQHFDVIQASAATLASTVADGGGGK
jgi:hypothetical protein